LLFMVWAISSTLLMVISFFQGYQSTLWSRGSGTQR
jgi:hypothetical protein